MGWPGFCRISQYGGCPLPTDPRDQPAKPTWVGSALPLTAAPPAMKTSISRNQAQHRESILGGQSQQHRPTAEKHRPLQDVWNHSHCPLGPVAVPWGIPTHTRSCLGLPPWRGQNRGASVLWSGLVPPSQHRKSPPGRLPEQGKGSLCPPGWPPSGRCDGAFPVHHTPHVLEPPGNRGL